MTGWRLAGWRATPALVQSVLESVDAIRTDQDRHQVRLKPPRRARERIDDERERAQGERRGVPVVGVPFV